ncbi:hypothetical protein NL676_028954 [Syzygium grande]|nr:hypothetical protein NL676_028954 [Syzygium grande]
MEMDFAPAIRLSRAIHRSMTALKRYLLGFRKKNRKKTDFARCTKIAPGTVRRQHRRGKIGDPGLRGPSNYSRYSCDQLYCTAESFVSKGPRHRSMATSWRDEKNRSAQAPVGVWCDD